ncbi:STAS domain-containing protein [Demetria terragena]|uniref:STAS domain-containing protein n=1 Tax=Demetria terragena TaxID=63959 RepID=UPI001B7F9F58|nr:STAS domain-containing protein [Demetria terragena]
MLNRAATATVEASTRGDIITVTGSLGVAAAADMRDLLNLTIDAGSGDVVLHLADAEVVDSTGLGLIIEAHRRAGRSGRRVIIADASPRLHRLLRRTRLHRVIETLPQPHDELALV